MITSTTKSFLIAITVAATLALHAQETEHKKTAEGSAVGKDTASCLKEASQMNQGVIQVAQIASQKGQNEQLKEFSQQLQKDHQRAQEKLETIAKKHAVTLPTTLDQECQDKISKLSSLSGSAFDKEFATEAIQGHAMAMAKLKEASTEATDPDLKEYTKDMLSKVKVHQMKAREVAKAVGIDQATIASLEAEAPAGVGTSGRSGQSESGTSASDRPEKKSSDEK